MTIIMTCSTALALTVDFLNPLTIEWQYSYNGDPQNGPWTTAGTSTNRVYVVLATPATATINNGNKWTTNYETVIDISCRNAKGKTVEADVVSAIYSGDFVANVGSGVKRKAQDGYGKVDGHSMHYYRPMPDPDPFNLPTILPNMLSSSDGVGDCYCWSELFLATLRVQGIATGGLVRITPNGTYPNDKKFLVKNWTFNAPANNTNPAPYYWTVDSDCIDASGAPGQGDLNPEALFQNHIVVGYPDATGSGSIYDPSYGTTMFPTKLAHEKASIDGFAYVGVPGAAGSVDVYYARKRTTVATQAELTYQNFS